MPDSDIIKLLVLEAKKYPLLSPEQEQVYISAYQKPLKALVEKLTERFSKEPKESAKAYRDRIFEMSKNLLLTEGTSEYSREAANAQSKMTLHNLNLVIRYVRAPKVTSLQDYDLYVEGMLGLLHALDKYDSKYKNKQGKPVKFSTYAVPWIKQNIKRGIQDKDRMIRIPIHIHDQIDVLRRWYGRLSSSSFDGSCPDDKKLAEVSGYTVEAVQRLGRHLHDIESLDVPANEEENMSGLSFLAAGADKWQPEGSSLENSLNREHLLRLIDKHLNENDALFIKLRFGLSPDNIDRTPKELANVFGWKTKDILKKERELIDKLKEVIDPADFVL